MPAIKKIMSKHWHEADTERHTGVLDKCQAYSVSDYRMTFSQNIPSCCMPKSVKPLTQSFVS